MRYILCVSKSKWIIMLTLLIMPKSFCQTSNFYLRGKVLSSFFLLEDNYLLTGTLGFEYEFRNNHSIGADFIYRKDWTEQDTTDDKNTNIFSSTQKIGFLVDYRYYFQPFKINHPQRFYIALSYRRTNQNLKNDSKVLFSNNNKISENNIFNDFGAALGYRISFSKTKDKFGIDTNIGFANRFKNESYNLFIDSNNSKQFDNIKSKEWLPTFRLNLYYKIK